MGTLRISLYDPGMTLLHHVGLAGLWMTLEALEREYPEQTAAMRNLGGFWQRERTAVKLWWDGDGKAFFNRLFTVSFRLTPDGRIWLPGIGHPDQSGDLGVTLQNALLNTYLQHGRHRCADSPNQPTGTLTLTIDETQVPVRYRKVAWYQHQRAANDFALDRPIRVKGWLFPGGAVRHSSYEDATALTEPPERWLALLYAPVATFYFSVRRAGLAVRPSFCLVLTELDDLPTLATLRRALVPNPVKELVVSGGADAALRVLSAIEARHLQEHLRAARCQVITFGKVGWVQAQQIRIDVFDAEAVPADARRQYALLHQALPAILRPKAVGRQQNSRRSLRSENTTSDDAESEVTERYIVSPVLDLAARNLVNGRSWWMGFARLLSDQLLRQQLKTHLGGLYQQQRQEGGLAAVVRNASAFTDPGAKAIVEACHEAWRRRLGQLSKEAKRGRFEFGTLVERERERWRVALASCRNLAALRATLMDFWSRAGAPIPVLQQHWQEILPYLTEARWQEARDLALLALVSYAGEERPETAEADVEAAQAGEEISA